MTTPCSGQWLLFDATDADSHREARALCATCPQLLACAMTAKEMPDKEGTWAGKLYGDVGAVRRAAEEAAWSEMDCRVAHAAFQRGERDEQTVIGNRVYERRMVAARKARRGAA